MTGKINKEKKIKIINNIVLPSIIFIATMFHSKHILRFLLPDLDF